MPEHLRCDDTGSDEFGGDFSESLFGIHSAIIGRSKRCPRSRTADAAGLFPPALAVATVGV
jgi:hypothetical protein